MARKKYQKQNQTSSHTNDNNWKNIGTQFIIVSGKNWPHYQYCGIDTNGLEIRMIYIHTQRKPKTSFNDNKIRHCAIA